MGIVEQYLSQLKIAKCQWRRATAILAILSLLVAIGVSWNLRMTGIAIANDASCGQQEHRHTEKCPMEKVLICDYSTQDREDETRNEPTDEAVDKPVDEPADEPADEPITEIQEKTVLDVVADAATNVLSVFVLSAYAEELPEGEQIEAAIPEHIHTDDCYEITWLCGIEEHLHDISCYSDTTADIESALDWEAGLPTLTNDWAYDLMCVARSQLGCGESERNYIVAEDGELKHGITRYGQWYGNPYGDWSGMFAMFCMSYANIPQDAIPRSPGVYNMLRLAQDAGVFLYPDGDMGNNGNLLFLDTDANGNADKLAIVTAYENGNIFAISGDWENAVTEITLSYSDPRIMGYINIGQIQAAWESQDKSVPSEPVEPQPEKPIEDIEEAIPEDVTAEETLQDSGEMPEKPIVSLDVEFPEDEIMRITAQISNLEEAMYTWQWQVSEDGNEPWVDIEGATGLVCELEDTEENLNKYYRLQGQKMLIMLRFMAAPPTEDTSEPEENNNTITSEPFAPFRIVKDNSTYTIDVYAMPVDADGKRIADIALTELDSISVTYSRNAPRTMVEDYFDSDLGAYHSAYLGSVATVSVDNIESVWSSRYSNNKYALAYCQTDGTVDNQWLTNSNASTSLYLRYIPQYTVTYESEEFEPVTENVQYGSFPVQTEPAAWSREGYTLIGWTVKGSEQTVYTFEEIIKLPVTQNVTYTAKWVQEVTVSFDLGEGDYVSSLDPVRAMAIPYGSSISPLPVPSWKNNEVAMSFAGWYLNDKQVTAEDKFYEDTILHARWEPKENGYFVYFMDFAREGQTPLVSLTYSVSEGQTVSPYIPGNAPSGTEWDGKWYLENTCTNAYNFSIPVSQMTDNLIGANRRDLYLYPGTQDVCRAIFVTYGTRVDPVSVLVGGTINLDRYTPERPGYEFAGWKLADGTMESGEYTLNETTTFYATWNPGYVPFEAILRIENANDTGLTQATILGTWYAKAGSNIKVNSTYSGSGDTRKGTHEVVCVIDGTEYPVYKDAALSQKASLADVYSTYFIYNNTGTAWTDEVNWDDVYTGGEVPYSKRPVSSSGDTIINFDYMRVRSDVKFVFSNESAYFDIFKLYRDGLLTGSVSYSGTKPTTTGENVSASGVSGTNVSWTYTAASGNGNNVYTLLNVKYGQRIYDDYPVGGKWLTVGNTKFYTWDCNGTNFSSRREDLSDAFFKGNGRSAKTHELEAEFTNYMQTALMYAIECLPGDKVDFTINGVGYKVQTHLCEVVNSSGSFSAKELLGCTDGVNPRANSSPKYYEKLNNSTAKVGGTSVRTLFGTTYWKYYNKYTGIDSLSDIDRAYIFYYNRIDLSISFSFAYDADGNGANETEIYENIAFGTPIAEYQFGAAGNERHPLLEREGYEFVGWLDANGFVLEAEDWESMVVSGDSENNSMIFIAKWEKISNNIVEYYEDRASTKAFETHYFEDGELVPYPTLAAYPDGWIWQEYGEGQYQRFDWDVPMYGEYGVQEVRTINGEERLVNVIRIYGSWDDSNTKVVYDANAPQGGISGTEPIDFNVYTLWKSEVPVVSCGETANADPDMFFVGWQLDRNGIVYQPGDHVPVQWPRTMTFVAQWATAEDIVYLRYDPNGGTPEDIYPDVSGFAYRKNATAAVWDNTGADGAAWFSRSGATFVGWNTKPDGSGTAYAPGASIALTDSLTTLYAQWERTSYTLSLYKVDSENDRALIGAVFGLYRQEDGNYLSVQSLETGVDGHITFQKLETDTIYKLVEERAPNGYAVIAKEIFFALRPYESTVSLRFYDSAGKEISVPNGVFSEYNTDSHFLTLRVKNLRGYALPSTGGTGVLPNVVCGLFLVSVPLVYGLSLKRRHKRQSRQ